jgi:hypothetical protein
VLASDYYLIAHSDTTGRPRLHPRAVGLGLAAGLLGELIVCERISMINGVLTVWDGRQPEDALARTVLEQIIQERQHRSVRTWLDYFALDAAGMVAERLTRAGVLARDDYRTVLLRRRTVYEPVDMSVAFTPQARLHTALSRLLPLTLRDATLAALVAATGLLDEVLWDSDQNARRYLTDLRACLPGPQQELAAHTEAALGAHVGAHRT